jgi:flagellar biosynthesis protein FlhG
MNKCKDSGKVIELKHRSSASSGKPTKHGKPAMEQDTRIITITSGKGGVGKTNIVANLGYALCRFGKRVLILDADLGLGNLDVLLGLTPEYNLSHVIRGEKRLAEIVISGPGRLKILPAASGIQEMTELSQQERHLVFSQLNDLLCEFDIMLIDTAAGISSNVLYFNINADEILVVATPEPTSITDAYALMKVLSVKYGSHHFKLVVNAAASEPEADDVYRQISLVADRFLNVEIEYYGGIVVDDNLKKGVRQQKVVTEMAPMSKASRNFATLARKIAAAQVPDNRRRTSQWGLIDLPS